MTFFKFSMAELADKRHIKSANISGAETQDVHRKDLRYSLFQNEKRTDRMRFLRLDQKIYGPFIW